MKPMNKAIRVAIQIAGFVTASFALAILCFAGEQGNEGEKTEFFRAPWNAEILGTGAVRPNAAQWAWGEANMVKTRKVKLNPLGLARVNEARQKRGLPPLKARPETIAEVGDEVVGAAAPDAASEASTVGSSVLPSYVDNSTLKYFPPIRSQGSLGSCAQFSAVYYTLTHMTAMARDWDAKNGGDSYRFSPKWTYNMLNGGANVGTWHYDAYSIAMKHGVATWAEFPYDSDYRAWCLNPAVWRNALNVRAAQAGKVLDVDTDTGLSQLKQLLANGYVLNFATYISSWQWKSISDDPSTTADDPFVGRSCVYMVNGTSGGHAMTIVGYNDDIWVDINSDGAVQASEKGALRIANSWGTSWNEAGFAWVSYQALRTRNPAYTSEGLFWYDEATWFTARPSYQPQMIAEFTLSHAKRNQLVLSLGVGSVGDSLPGTTWYPNKVLYYSGGAYAFDGTSVACDGTFCLDFSDIAPTTSGAKRYFLRVYDSTTGDPATVKSWRLLDLANNVEVPGAGLPQTVDAATLYAYVDYDRAGGDLPPVANIVADPTSGPYPLPVTLDGSGSYDPDGQIVSYEWDFGDGSAATGNRIQHQYNTPGKYNATLTVTDNLGAKSTSAVTIVVTDPYTVAAPSNLSVKASSRTITLSWTDNSDNETEFCIEYAVRAKTGPGPYYELARVPANQTSYSYGASAGTYYYRVRACNANTGVCSTYSNVVSIRVK
ncbi:MAG: PKD domain-containing protein [Verrucomicrobiota bacterium]|nr:PKD domain-containing protein [Verrucomicrobiota bacterium]